MLGGEVVDHLDDGVLQLRQSAGGGQAGLALAANPLGYRALAGVVSRVKSYEAQDVLRREAAELRTEAVGVDAPVVEVVQMIITQISTPTGKLTWATCRRPSV
jgi:hypothetical protein